MEILDYFKPGGSDNHWHQRVKERLDELIDIILPDDFYKPEDNKTEVNKTLLTAIRRIVQERVASFSQQSDLEPNKQNITIIATIHLLRNGKTYIPSLKVLDTKEGEESENFGNSYIAITTENFLVTLMLVPEDKATKENLIRRTINHARKSKDQVIGPNDIAIHFAPKHLVTLSADHLLKKGEEPSIHAITNPSQLPYTVRGDYRKSTPGQDSIFTHKEYGKGKIIATEPGMSSRGKWDSITVQFPSQPSPKTFKNLYTTSHFRSLPGKVPVAESIDKRRADYIRALSILTGKTVVLV